MKKLVFALSALALFIATSSSAKPQLCGYTDQFHTDQDAPPTLRITNLDNDGNVITQQLSQTQFSINDATNCPTFGGNAYVTYSVDGSHYCTLAIHDGPYTNTPSVTAYCQGLSYNGISSDGILSYSYDIKLS
jgi:hypothetical protein